MTEIIPANLAYERGALARAHTNTERERIARRGRVIAEMAAAIADDPSVDADLRARARAMLKEAHLLVEECDHAVATAEKHLGQGRRSDLVTEGNNVPQQQPSAERVARTRLRKEYEALGDEGREQVRERIEETGDAPDTARKTVLRKRRDEEAQRKSAVRESTPPSDWQPVYHVSAIADLDRIVAAESIDLILTDPPYEKAALSAYGELAAFAAHALKPGGQLAVLTGAVQLPDVFAEIAFGMDGALEWRDLIAYGLPRANSVVWSSKTMVSWKPVLVYAKLPRDNWPRFANVVYPEGLSEQAEGHRWAQNLDGFIKLTQMLATPGDVICDPFLGGGTTAEAAMERGCAFIGADIDADSVEMTRERMA